MWQSIRLRLEEFLGAVARTGYYCMYPVYVPPHSPRHPVQAPTQPVQAPTQAQTRALPPGHPERLAADRPLSGDERALWAGLKGIRW